MTAALDAFFARLAVAPARALMTDYDGTLAPFREKQDLAAPYPGVEETLGRIARGGATRLVVVTGRAAGEIPKLMPLAAELEIWGSHGLERRLADGTYHVETPPPAARAALARARTRAAEQGWSGYLEIKPSGIALHWRGRPAKTVEALRGGAREAWGALAAGGAGLELHGFDGGVELRVAGRTKAAAVNTLLSELGKGAAIAYLGDDATDEDAFLAMRGRGLAVLVRSEPRETLADFRLTPPAQLLDFLERWTAACGRSR